MSVRRQKSVNKRESSGFASNRVIIVAVKASKEISRTALTWALTNVVKPGDCVKLLVIVPCYSSSKKLWSLPIFHNDCATKNNWRSMTGTISEQKDHITELCNQMMCQLQDTHDLGNVKMKMKVVYGSESDGAVASEAKRTRTQWIIIDKQMKKEANSCMEQLDCNIIVVKSSGPKVLRLNLIQSTETLLRPLRSYTERLNKGDFDLSNIIKVPNVTPTSSPERTSSMSSLDVFQNPMFMSELTSDPKVKKLSLFSSEEYGLHEPDSDSDSDIRSSFSARTPSQRWVEDNQSSSADSELLIKALISTTTKDTNADKNRDSQTMNVREMISYDKNPPPKPPPLCSSCNHRSPSFGQPPRLYSYAELERATSGFSRGNFLAEGGYGSVHRGVLDNGQVVAVKLHKPASTQGDREFCSEVRVLSCAQHRNVVMLIGYCVEDGKRLLVYEYICNGSLDSYLYGRNDRCLNWESRRRIAIGASRGLRYLHEECRVGCIIHRDMRPNNILLTHDFEPLVGDFGLAKLQVDPESNVETRVIGTFGYLAPEYAQSGQVTEKSDVYSFGVVLVELVTGRKAVDINRPKGEQFLVEWARPKMEENDLSELVDPSLVDRYSEEEVETMLCCASLCLQRDPDARPRMSQVLRMLEGDNMIRRTSSS